jgi:leucyl-tRNA synthetase
MRLAFLQAAGAASRRISPRSSWARLGGTGRGDARPRGRSYDPARPCRRRRSRSVVQVNGKHRGDQLVPVGTAQDAALAAARANPRVQPFLEGKTVKRVVYVPGSSIVVE